MEIYFLRHGSTEYTEQRIAQGQLDIPLNSHGEEDADKARLMLETLPVQIIYSSPLLRCKQTTEIVNKNLHLPIVFDDRLKEAYMGLREGTFSGIWAAEDKVLFHKEPELFGAEPNGHSYARAIECFHDILEQGLDTLIVSHGGVYKNIFRFLHNITDFQMIFKVPEPGELINLTF